MKCKKARALFFDYIDGKLIKEEEKELKAHLKECKKCRYDYEAVKDFYLKLNFESTLEPPDFESIKENILEEESYIKKWIFALVFIIGILLGAFIGSIAFYDIESPQESIAYINENYYPQLFSETVLLEADYGKTE